MDYFDYISHNDDLAYTFLANTFNNISVTMTGSSVKVCVEDLNKVNSVAFYMVGCGVGEMEFICEMIRDIVYSANGKVRKLTEDSRVLLLMKQYDLSEIYHTNRNCANRSYGTLWTQEDAYALNS